MDHIQDGDVLMMSVKAVKWIFSRRRQSWDKGDLWPLQGNHCKKKGTE